MCEKLPEHEDKPITTIAPSEGVSHDHGASSEGLTKAPAPVIKEPTPATVPVPITEPTITETPPTAPPSTEPTAQPIHPCRSERAIRPSWVKVANDKQKAVNNKQKADNKALCKAQAECRELKAKSQTTKIDKPHSRPPDPMNPISEIKVANLTYLAAHGPITPLSYKEAICSPDPREWHQAMSEEISNLTQ